MRFKISTRNTAALDHDSWVEILELAKACSNPDLNLGPWLRVSSLRESAPEVTPASLAVLATDEEERICGVALVASASRSLPSCQLFVAPHLRRRGLGHRLLYQALHESSSKGLRVWNHGNCQDGHSFARAENLNLLQSLALFVKDTDEDERGYGREPRSEQPFQISASRNLQANWREVVTEAYQTTSVLDELESRSWWPDSWGIVVPKSEGGELAGVLVARSVTYQLRPSIENHVMAVAPRWQGTGIAKILLSGLVTLARELKLSSAISYVDVANRNAMRAHQTSGFSKLSEDSVYVFFGE